MNKTIKKLISASGSTDVIKAWWRHVVFTYGEEVYEAGLSWEEADGYTLTMKEEPEWFKDMNEYEYVNFCVQLDEMTC